MLITFNAKPFAQAISSALPVTIIMNADRAGEHKVAISWTILVRINTVSYDVEKSNDGISWKSIATVNSDDSSSVPFTYTVLDQVPQKGINFYTIRLKDISGFYTYTGIKCVRVDEVHGITVYPNPSSNTLNITLAQFPHAEWIVSIINSNGQVMTQKKYAKNINTATLPVDNYPNGNYIVNFAEGNDTQSSNLMINHH